MESKLPEGRVELGCVRGINEERKVVNGKKLRDLVGCAGAARSVGTKTFGET